jgi:hypothetical protein
VAFGVVGLKKDSMLKSAAVRSGRDDTRHGGQCTVNPIPLYYRSYFYLNRTYRSTSPAHCGTYLYCASLPGLRTSLRPEHFGCCFACAEYCPFVLHLSASALVLPLLSEIFAPSLTGPGRSRISGESTGMIRTTRSICGQVPPGTARPRNGRRIRVEAADTRAGTARLHGVLMPATSTVAVWLPDPQRLSTYSG